MNGPWKDEEGLLKCMQYWQKRALEAERDLGEALDDLEEYVDLILEARGERDYYKAQFLDKDSELWAIIKYLQR